MMIVQPTTEEIQFISRRRGARLGARRLGLRGGAGFSPKLISGLVAWYRADLGITIGTGVSAWADQSGSGDANKNATQGTGANQPTFNATDAAFNNRPSISFGASQLLVTGTWSVALAQPASIFVVAKGPSQAYLCDSLNATQFALFTLSGAPNIVNLYATTQVATATSDASAIVGIAQFIHPSNAKWNGSQTTTQTLIASAGPNGATGVTLGNFEGNGIGGATLAEIGYFNKALSQAEINSLNAYASTRYGITIGA